MLRVCACASVRVCALCELHGNRIVWMEFQLKVVTCNLLVFHSILNHTRASITLWHGNSHNWMTHARQTNTIPFMCSGGATATTYTHTLAHHYERLLFRQLYSMSVANCLIPHWANNCQTSSRFSNGWGKTSRWAGTKIVPILFFLLIKNKKISIECLQWKNWI